MRRPAKHFRRGSLDQALHQELARKHIICTFCSVTLFPLFCRVHQTPAKMQPCYQKSGNKTRRIFRTINVNVQSLCNS